MLPIQIFSMEKFDYEQEKSWGASLFSKQSLPMTIKEARLRLAELRKRQSAVRAEMNSLRGVIVSKGGIVDPGSKRRIRRNIAIFKRWKSGETFGRIAKRFGLSLGHISGICHFITIWSQRGIPEYRSLKKLVNASKKTRR